MDLSQYSCLVIKIGSAILVDAKSGDLRLEWLTVLASDIAKLRTGGTDIVIVSSGAIALGRKRLSLMNKKLSLAEKQACASAGQSMLTQAYEKTLGDKGHITAQALLTLYDTEHRRRWLNARSTLQTLLGLGAIPVINENDTVATDEIRYGDNDRLAARTAQMLGADGLILLSDIDGLYTADPRRDDTATHIPIVDALDYDIMTMGSGANAEAALGSGGMATKLMAAKIATHAGCDMIISDGRAIGALGALSNGATHTRFVAEANPRKARAQWIAGALKPSGSVKIDAGALKALNKGKSLLAAGVTHITGDFGKGDAVSVLSDDGTEVARGLVAYDAVDAKKILGLQSTDIAKVLGYDNGTALIHRDNLAML